MTDIDGDALLIEEIEEINAEFREQLTTALLDDKATDELHTTWFAHSDPLVKVAAARVLAKRQVEPAVLEAIAGDPDLTVRFAALRSSASADRDMFERAAEIAAGSEPGFWTCTDCGAAQSPEDRDCAGCTRGTRSDLTEEIKRLRGKPENTTQA